MTNTKYISGVVHLPYEGCPTCPTHEYDGPGQPNRPTPEAHPACSGAQANECEICSGDDDDDNPNRPTEPDYCAQCGQTPCLWIGFSDHYTEPLPLTLAHYEQRQMCERIEALTDTQRRDALLYLSSDIDMMERALHMVIR